MHRRQVRAPGTERPGIAPLRACGAVLSQLHQLRLPGIPPERVAAAAVKGVIQLHVHPMERENDEAEEQSEEKADAHPYPPDSPVTHPRAHARASGPRAKSSSTLPVFALPAKSSLAAEVSPVGRECNAREVDQEVAEPPEADWRRREPDRPNLFELHDGVVMKLPRALHPIRTRLAVPVPEGLGRVLENLLANLREAVVYRMSRGRAALLPLAVEDRGGDLALLVVAQTPLDQVHQVEEERA
eukprot:CAMPEP_0180345676 /NCGR_PEP_ID=MMETSP0989-20121125/3445_1 /TAXON_ID=697907 /ORGANISM="non described non described, Strain CCMP2293" /LENGTH=242 /DNA_ID=CAMNT_0022334713 /DNA_START=136 /DNA_END=860 /DNA_ORIENTATION=-